MKNREIKRLLISKVLIFMCFIVIVFVFNYYIYTLYKQELIKNNTYVIANIINNHPELEDEIINSIVSNKGNYEISKQMLKKYGLFDIENIEYLSSVKNIKNKIIFYNLIFFGIMFILTSIIYIVFIKKQYKKINDIKVYLNNILNNNYSFDIKDYEEGIISDLKNDIYKITVLLKEQSEESIKAKKHLQQVLSDISHQLKTPLTSMYVINDLLSNENLNPKLKKEFLIKNRNQLERIEWLVSTLLKISMLDSGTIILKKENVNVCELIKDAVEPLNIPIELKQQKIIINGKNDIVINVDYRWTLEAIINILKNAHEHTPRGGSIKIEYNSNPIYTEISITDNGEGIAKTDIKHIFERFYKAKKSNKESIGIGLNMAKKIIDMQNGIISVSSTIGKGTTFTIKFFKSNI